MSAFTRNLPWPIKDLGVSIIGEVSPSRILAIPQLTSEIIKQECYTSLIESLNFGDVKCLKYSLSKALGVGIVFGGSIMKVPQISLSECP
jgi:mannose-P-dolichol utilization defect 1